MKVAQDFDQRIAGKPESEEICTTAPMHEAASASQEDSSGISFKPRSEKSGYEELPKEMHEMKIKDDKSDNQNNLKVVCLLYFACPMCVYCFLATRLSEWIFWVSVMKCGKLKTAVSLVN